MVTDGRKDAAKTIVLRLCWGIISYFYNLLTSLQDSDAMVNRVNPDQAATSIVA